MGFFSALSTAATVAIETSRAASAARASLSSGKSVAQAVQAFAAATETELDDKIVAELIEQTERAIDASRSLAIWAIKIAPRLDANLHKYIDLGRSGLDRAEASLPDVRKGLAKFASGASYVANRAEDLLGR